MPDKGRTIIEIVMIETPFTVKTAALSNVIAFVVTGLILGVWYAFIKNFAMALWVIGICLGLLVVVAAIDFAMVRCKLKKERIDFGLRSEANQWAPIAGASMIVGWSALKTNFATHEGTLLILIGLLYSLWCIVLALDAKQLHRKKTMLYLSVSHLFVPAMIGLGLAHSVNIQMLPTQEQAKQDACYNARVTFNENQCRSIGPLDPVPD